MGLLDPLVLETFSPPTEISTFLLCLQGEAFGLDDVKKDFPDKVGSSGVGLFQTGTEPDGKRRRDFVTFSFNLLITSTQCSPHKMPFLSPKKNCVKGTQF